MHKRIEFISLTLCFHVFFSMTGGCSPDITAQTELAQVRESDGYFRQAESIYQKITKYKPRTAEAMVAQKNLVLLYFKMDNCTQASQALRRLIEDYAEQPGLMDSLHEIVGKFTYGSLHGRPGTSVEAWYVQQQIQHYLNRSEIKKGPLAVRVMNVVILTELQPAEVVEETDKLITDFRDDSELPRVLWYIAEKFTKLKEFEKANVIYQRIKQLRPDSSYAGKAYLDFQKTYIFFLIESELDAKVQGAIDRLITDFRDYPGLLSALDDIAGKYESLKKYDDTIAIYHRMIKIDPHSEFAPLAQQAIGWIYFARGMYDQAKSESREIVNSYPDSGWAPDAQCRLAKSYGSLGETEQAIKEYRKVIDTYPASWAAATAEKQIERLRSLKKN